MERAAIEEALARLPVGSCRTLAAAGGEQVRVALVVGWMGTHLPLPPQGTAAERCVVTVLGEVGLEDDRMPHRETRVAGTWHLRP